MTLNTEKEPSALTNQQDAISKTLVRARLEAGTLPDYPGQLPETLQEAYAIQAASIDRWPDELAGWKVAMIPVPDRERFTENRLIGPVFKTTVRTVEPGGHLTVPIIQGGFAAIEAEFVLRLGKTISPNHKGLTDQELLESIDRVFGGAEIASSPMAVAVERGATSIISDFGLNAGVLVGPEIPDWSSLAPESMTARVEVDGETVGEASAAAIHGGLLQAYRFLVEQCAERGIVLPAGTLVSSGAVTGVHEVSVSSRSLVDFGVFGAFEVDFEAMQPRT